MASPFDIAELNWLLCIHVEDRPTLARLARTSTRFRDCALDVLYSDNILMSELIKCIPPHLLTAGGAGKTLQENIMIPNLENIMKYFRRVKDITILNRDEEQWLPIFHGLVPLVSYFFPNLHTLTLYEPNSLYMSHPTSFISSSLQTVAFYSTEDAFFAVWLPALKDHCANLSSITLKGYNDQEIDPLILSSFLSWRNLKHVTILDSICRSMLLTLAMLPSLENLELPPAWHESGIQMPTSFPVPLLSFRSLRILELSSICRSGELPDFPTNSLPALRILKLYRCSQVICELMLERIVHGTLEELEADIVDVANSPSEMDTFLGHLGPFSGSLKKVHIITWPREDDNFIQSWPFGQACGHLLSLSQLKELVVDIGPGFTMTQGDVDRIGDQWKGLVVCDLRLPWDASAYHAGLNLEGLARLCAACPQLKRGTIPFSALDIPLDPGGGWNSHLEFITLPNSPISDGIAVANFLRRLFPRMRSFDFSQKYRGQPGNACWAQVDERLWWLIDNDKHPDGMNSLSCTLGKQPT
ncbi:hypothetical protein DL96DRAFT_144592 [Flagelloscypha sp. PMI_526]|nr:hypothetical protein DL96DRAFT_144592 [Flagelloscypha sp. PMI_526]